MNNSAGRGRMWISVNLIAIHHFRGNKIPLRPAPTGRATSRKVLRRPQFMIGKAVNFHHFQLSADQWRENFLNFTLHCQQSSPAPSIFNFMEKNAEERFLFLFSP
jgi:hypothetical protein